MVTDFQKKIYDDLVAEEVAGGWDQVSYPATIQYREPDTQNHDNLWSSENNILIEVDDGASDRFPYMVKSGAPSHRVHIVHVYIEVMNPQATFQTNKQYLYTLLGAFDTWITAKAYDDIAVYHTYLDPQNPLRADIWMNCNEVDT
jgi:hypothetical protein